MTRSKRTTAEPTFRLYGVQIDDQAVKELERLIDQPIGVLLQRKIGVAVDMAIGGAPHLEGQPRPSDYVREFRDLRNLARRLCDKVGDWSGYYKDQLGAHGVDAISLEISLCKVIEAAGQVLQDFTGAPSRGAPPIALRQAELMLSALFRKHYQGPKRGMVRREHDFILTALRAGGVNPGGHKDEDPENTYARLRQNLRRGQVGT